jgi:formylglycine-generating enzyme required for sulfatase activity
MISLFISLVANCSNLQVGEVRILNHKQISVNLGWSQCWNLKGRRAPFNHDAVYLFLKGKQSNTESISLPMASVSMKSTLVSAKLKSVGVVFETETQDTALRFTAIIDLVTPLSQGNWDISAYALEMVYIPEGSFWLGDSLSNNTLGGKNGSPLLIDGNPKPIFQIGDTNALSNNNTSGFSSFYLMKQEISQASYTDFLNNISKEEAEVLAPSIFTFPIADSRRNRCFITKVNGKFGTDANQNGILDEWNDGGSVACNWLTNKQLLAYLSWAGLRPFTELEFEKACRGPLKPKAKEFAWGTQYATDANTITQSGTSAEKVSEIGNDSSGLTNHALLAGNLYLEGPIRSGFEFFRTSNRVIAGAGYHGNADLSGNLWEQCLKGNINTTLPLGNGTTNYPIEWGNANDYIPRGGAWLSLVFNILGYGFRDLATSDRFYIDYDLNESRGTIGGRGAL